MNERGILMTWSYSKSNISSAYWLESWSRMNPARESVAQRDSLTAGLLSVAKELEKRTFVQGNPLYQAHLDQLSY